MLPLSLLTVFHPSIIFKRTDKKNASFIYKQSNLSMEPYSIFSNINILYIYIYVYMHIYIHKGESSENIKYFYLVI